MDSAHYQPHLYPVTLNHPIALLENGSQEGRMDSRWILQMLRPSCLVWQELEVRDSNGNWIPGTCRNIGQCSITKAELWAIFDTLSLAWDRGFRKVKLESDSQCVIKMIKASLNFYYAVTSVLLRQHTQELLITPSFSGHSTRMGTCLQLHPLLLVEFNSIPALFALSDSLNEIVSRTGLSIVAGIVCEPVAVTVGVALLGIRGILLNRRNIPIMSMPIESMLLAVNSNFLVFSVSSDDMMGQSFASLVSTVAAAESAIGVRAFLAGRAHPIDSKVLS
ncbi:hypothetical protein RIF29_48022 [Crotalaria pallida]|uniref:RNase H type-1 domain-containing protein n=1 Tax=Crotalaria pallida TaxID=3830 RepID=A0AAN9DS90_CROPI